MGFFRVPGPGPKIISKFFTFCADQQSGLLAARHLIALATSTGYAGRRLLPWLACNVARASYYANYDEWTRYLYIGKFYAGRWPAINLLKILKDTILLPLYLQSNMINMVASSEGLRLEGERALTDLDLGQLWKKYEAPCFSI